MINTRIEIEGNDEDVQLFDDMFEYVSEFGSDISHYYPIHRDNDEEYIVESVDICEDPDFITHESIEIDGVEYTRVNWGESEISFIKSSGLYQTLYTIWHNNREGDYYNYKSLFFVSEEEAQSKADELNEEN